MLNSEKSQKIFLFFLPNIPSSFRAVSAVSGQFHSSFNKAVSKQKQFQEKF